MWKQFLRTCRKIEDQTPDDRIRYADFLRVVAILVVVLGHWLLAYITVEDGQIQAERLLAIVPETQWLTWFFQVMPLFFFVGGLANAIGWDSSREKGTGYVNWLRKRAKRLLAPVIPLIFFWIPVVLLLNFLGTPTDLLVLATQAVMLPIWFLAAYLCVITISPAAYWLHRRFGVGALLFFVAMALVVDILHKAGVPYVGWSNFVWVWGAVHQAGFFWHDGRLPNSVARGVLIALVGYGLLLVLVLVFDYPLSMVGTGEADRTNNSPPSIALVVLTIGQIGLIIALKRPAERLLQRTAVWGAVVLAGSRLMTVYLWHMTAMVAVAAAAYPTGLWPVADRVDGIWWLTRIPWLLLLTLTLIILVLAFGRFESPGPVKPTSIRGWPGRLKAIAGVALTTAGLAMLVAGGLYSESSPLQLPWIPLVILITGLAGLGVVSLSAFRRGEEENAADRDQSSST